MDRNARIALSQRKPEGGTWIGTNDSGLTLALVNWYAKPQRDRSQCVSRGIVIPHLLAAESFAEMAAMLADLPLSRINPFRLIAVSASERMVREWRWDGAVMTCSRFGWKRRHWFSSGHDEPLANKMRAAMVRDSRKGAVDTRLVAKAASLASCRRQGPFSVCMHRADARTVSYTEIVAAKSGAAMRHAAGSPCTRKPRPPRLLPFASRV